MFEDSIFESAGKIRTRSRGWMFAAFALNSSILLALILIPLICPKALPRQMMAFLLETPPAPAPEPVKQQPIHVAPKNVQPADPFTAPTSIPTTIYRPPAPEPPPVIAIIDPAVSLPGDFVPSFGPSVHPIVRSAVRAIVHVSSTNEEVLLLHKTMPIYPAIAKAAHVEGTVTLAATISKAGTIEGLRAVSGPPMLQQAALDAVKTWLYRPYQLDGGAVEVETTVNVIFALNR